MDGWPQVSEPLLRERQGMSTEEFLKLLTELLEAMPARELDDEHYERAIGYPWERRPGSCLVTDKGVEDLEDIDAKRRNELVHEYVQESADRVPLLTYGANSSPERLALKLAHLPESDHEALILSGDLEGFDVGAVAQPPVFSSMPATLIPSPGTNVRVAVLLLTPAQFTALWWTELTYLVGALTGITLATDVVEDPIDRVILFISRWGAFCVDGEPVAMAAIPAKNRRSAALTQTEILDAAARMAIGEDACARDLVKASYENPAAFMAEHYASFRAASVPFESEHWTKMPVDERPSRSPVSDAECLESLGRFPRMAFWGREIEWHERDVVVPAFRQWLEAQGWETETETEFVDVVAHRGNETIYAEVKGRTNSRPGAGLDTLYGQLLRRMPAEEPGDPNTRFAVVIPTGAEPAALRVPKRVRDVLRIDVYAVSDDGQVERLAD